MVSFTASPGLAFNPLKRQAGVAEKFRMHATHGPGSFMRTPKALRHRRQTLEEVGIPEDQWVPLKDSILVDSKFLQENESGDASVDRYSHQSAERLRQALLDIDAEGSAAERWAPGEWMMKATVAGVLGVIGVASDPTSEALAEEVASEKAAGGIFAGVSGQEAAILLAPVIIYSLYTVYRTAINPRVKIGDFLLAIVAFAIFGNIFSILILKLRLF